MKDVARAGILAEARSWIGTPYHPAADIKGVGVDCGMLLIRVFVAAGLAADFDPRPYPSDWHLHRSEERYLGFLMSHCDERPSPDGVEAGDIMVFRFGRCWSHGGIVTAARPLRLVHAYAPAGCVIEETLEDNPGLSASHRMPRVFVPRIFTT